MYISMSHYFIFFYPVTIISLSLTYSAPLNYFQELTDQRTNVDVEKVIKTRNLMKLSIYFIKRVYVLPVIHTFQIVLAKI